LTCAVGRENPPQNINGMDTMQCYERKYPVMKKIVALILVMVLLAVGLTACKKAEKKAEEAAAATEEKAEEVVEAAEEKAEAGKGVLEAMKEALGEQVHDVRISNILKSAACCLTADGPVSLEMEKYMRKVDGDRAPKAQRVLELNPDSAPYAAVKKALEEGDQEKVAKYSKLLYGQALMLADLPLEDPAAYAQLVCSLMI